MKMLPVLAAACRRRKLPVGKSWRMDETYVKVAGQWKYLYRAVDCDGNTVDFLLSAKRDHAAARAFFDRAMDLHGVPEKITIDKSAANTAAIVSIQADSGLPIEMRQWKYLNNIVEQDHRAVKRIARPMLGFKTFSSARILIACLASSRYRDRTHSSTRPTRRVLDSPTSNRAPCSEARPVGKSKNCRTLTLVQHAAAGERADGRSAGPGRAGPSHGLVTVLHAVAVEAAKADVLTPFTKVCRRSAVQGRLARSRPRGACAIRCRGPASERASCRPAGCPASDLSHTQRQRSGPT